MSTLHDIELVPGSMAVNPERNIGPKEERMTTANQTMTAYLCAKGAADAIEFYGQVFGFTPPGVPVLELSE